MLTLDLIIHLLNQYGYIVLFISLMLELIFLPIPNEALMSYVGVLCFQGKMNIYLSIISAGLGGSIGITISYWLGYKLGAPFFRNYGHYIHMGPEKMDKMSSWYKKYGKVLLIFSFFIPGVRHIASIISGVIKLPFRTFSVFANIGVLLWVGVFISLGNLLGPRWDMYEAEIKKWLLLGSILIAVIALIYIAIKANKQFVKESFLLLNQAIFKKYKSFLKIKFMIFFIFTLFVIFFSLMVGTIQNFISHENDQFNLVTKTIIFSLFNKHWHGIMIILNHLSSMRVLAIIALISAVVIFINNKNRTLELRFWVVTLAGDILLSKGIHWITQFILGNRISPHFPDMPSILVLSIYGFLFIMLIRHKRNWILSFITFVFFVLVLSWSFTSRIYLHQIRPSDLVAGYVFSAVWISGMLLALEMFRFLNLLKKESVKNEPIHKKRRFVRLKKQ